MSQVSTPDIVTIAAGDTRTLSSIDALLDDRGQSRTLRHTLMGIVAGVIVLFAWAMLAQVDELARARGEVQPGGHVQVLQSQEGGTIVKLHVKEGDSVKVGQVIADFATTDIEKLRTQTDIKLNALAIDRERMLAVLESRKPDFASFQPEYPMLVQQALMTYREQIANRDAAIAAKRGEAGQQSALIGGAEENLPLIQREIREAQDRLRRLEEGAKKGVVTQLALSDARQQVSSLEERLADTTARTAGMRSTVGGVGAEVARVRAEFNQQLSQEVSKVTEQLRELQAERKALEDRQGRIEIKAPVTGIVMNLPQTAEGAVVAPGGVVAEIVPTGMDIVMEVMVLPRDIGFIKEGQRASVKLDSFDSARFGAVEGHVKRVAPTSTKMKENGAPFYKVEVALVKPFVGAENHRLMPGMTGEADIATGRKSVMQYLLKPIFLASDTAFHER
ncbi:MAG: HlyD family type I secretion periplasmic adaptor subunit [Rhodoferax sp.]|uniref:HlyD family type I secretion periplasmic adaptor subunit n=1 Tax=Rhodoferax sp. TaxID=50421 RepID=UPI001B506F58|nr:HlyD family type I secretion periplasmic adaptor subunit [Rhodoferax sp.]MBP9737853.1 HlyD family type I secretion periplasmic adaptor subunit [Rhodoferax sp.]MBP9905900.1 HlyD family type I secretion periplasmic adaptor subunit [Rhodoferax sp.]